MSSSSSIEWTDATWNPVRGCVKVSPGCKHCYAETFAERFRGTVGHPYEHGFDVQLVPSKLQDPLTWKAPRRVFVNSMSDLFQEDVPDEFIARVASIMQRASWHTYQVLTKRADRMVALLADPLAFAARLPNVWWGVSVEDRTYGLPRLEILRASLARVRFLSVEPLLERMGPMNLKGIDWVIVGGESGPRARPIDIEWVRELRDDCRRQRVPFFFKQWGGRRKKAAGRILDGRTWDEFPKIPRGRSLRASQPSPP